MSLNRGPDPQAEIPNYRMTRGPDATMRWPKIVEMTELVLLYIVEYIPLCVCHSAGLMDRQLNLKDYMLRKDFTISYAGLHLIELELWSCTLML